MRLNPTFNQPAKHPASAIGDITGYMIRLQGEALFGPLNHRLSRLDLLLLIFVSIVKVRITLVDSLRNLCFQ